MGLEPGSGVSLDPYATIEQETKIKQERKIEQERIERAKQNIEAGLSVSAFSSEKEEEYEKSNRHVYQLQLQHFEQERLEKIKINKESQATYEEIKGLEERILTLQNCQRPLFEHYYPLKEEMLDHAMRVIHKVFNIQIAAVFLINKKNILKRYSLYGVTNLNQTVSSGWFAEEKYAIDAKSFVGKTALASSSYTDKAITSRFGEIHCSAVIDQDLDIEKDNLDRYRKDCGEIYQIVALPINNHSRTFGVLRIINKIDPSSHNVLKNSSFTDNDLVYLSLFASEIGSALLNFERDSNRRLFSSLMKEICRPEFTDSSKAANVGEVLQTKAERIKGFINMALNKLVKNESSPFNFAIIRLLCENQKVFRVASLAAVDNKLKIGRKNNDIEVINHNTFVSYVASCKQHIVISDISHKIARFHNKTWLQKHKLSTFCCFPLCFRSSQVFGTLSLYTAYRYTYDTKSIELLQSFCDALSTFLYVELDYEVKTETENLFESVCKLMNRETN
jgi:hypothetical protein